MTTDRELAEALRERVAAIADHALRATDPEAHLARLRQASERITALVEDLPPNIHPQLRHYLERSSYDKALAWLDQEGLTTPTK